MRRLNRQSVCLIATIAAVSLPVLASETVLQDNFANGVVENSNTTTNYWTQRSSGALSAVNEPVGGPLQITAGGSQYPHGQIVTDVQHDFNFFRTPITISASGINFTSSTGSLNKSILRFSLSSQTLTNNDQSEYGCDDAIALRLESGNNTPGQYAMALGIKENYPNHNSEYDGYQLLNPGKNADTSFSGPIRSFQLTWSPQFFNIKVTHDTSPTNTTPQTFEYVGPLDQQMANWVNTTLGGSLTGDTAMFIQNQLNNAGAAESSTVSVGQVTVNKLVQTWLPANGEAYWSNASNWSDQDIEHLNGDFFQSSVPNFAGANVKFASGGGTVTLDLDQTAGVIIFDSASSYKISPDGNGQGTLQMATKYFNSEVTVLQGSHTIYSPMVLHKDIVATVTPANGKLTLAGQLIVPPALTTIKFSKEGAGEAEVLNARLNTLAVNGGTLKVTANPGANSDAGASLVKSLSMSGTPAAPTAKLDLTNNALVIDYTGTSPITDVRGRLSAGFSGGAWTGNGIVSSSAIAASKKTGIGYAESAAMGTTSFAGQSFDTTSVVMAYVLLGDTNLSGNVDSTDFSAMAGGFGSSGAVWTQGDVNYDGKVNTVDFNYLAGNFGSSTPAPTLGSVVPEPAGLLGFGVLAGLLLPRRASRGTKL
jgi:hypothetical protein